MRIDIYSDVICPWCYIGKRRLERALADRPQEALTLHWRAFQLNPDMPARGMDRQLYLQLKFGNAASAERIYREIRAVGEEEGIAFAFEATWHEIFGRHFYDKRNERDFWCSWFDKGQLSPCGGDPYLAFDQCLKHMPACTFNRISFAGGLNDTCCR